MAEPVIALRYESVDVRLRAVRLALWVALCVGIISGTLYWLASLQRHALLTTHDAICWSALSGAIAVFAVLLRTTPSSAIRLSRGASNVIILSGSVMLCAAALAWTGLAPPLRPGFPPFRIGLPIVVTMTSSPFTSASRLDTTLPDPPPLELWKVHAPQTLHPRIASTLAVFVTTLLLLIAMARAGRSAWWAVVFAWHPLTIVSSAAFGDAFMIMGPPILVTSMAMASITLTRRTASNVVAWTYICVLLVSATLPTAFRPSTLLLALAVIPFLDAPFGWTGMIWCAAVVATLVPRLPSNALVELLPAAVAAVCEFWFGYRRRMNGASRDITSAGGFGMP